MPHRHAVRGPKRTDPLSATLASGALATLVLHLAVRPDERQHFRALLRRTGLPVRSLQRELARLGQLGVLSRIIDGRLVRFALREDSPAWRVLRAAVRELASPAAVLRAAMAEVTGVHAAFIFGSFARDEARADSDIDLLVIGDSVDDEALARATIDTGVLLGRSVNVVQYTMAELARRTGAGNAFVWKVLDGPKLWVLGDARRLARIIRSAAA